MSKWEAQAEFMRKCGATHATWSDAGELTSLTLAPAPKPAPTVAPAPAKPQGIAARMMKNHEIQFAHSRIRPPLNIPNEATSVPRAVAAKQEAARGSTKAQKRTA